MTHRYTVSDIEPRILYEDKQILVCHKPAGLAVQSASVTSQDLESLLRTRQKGAWLGVIHRLDQPVEGLVLFAKTQKATAACSRQLTSGEMKKTYLAVAAGLPPAQFPYTLHLEDWLLKETRSNLSRVVKAGTAGGKKASLDCTFLAAAREEGGKESGSLLLLKILLHTGRHHQIRVQLSHAGYPLLGDRKYGVSASLPAETGPGEDPANERKETWRTDLPLALCAASLSFSHPVSGKKVSFDIKPEGPGFFDFKDQISRCEYRSFV